MVKVVNNVLQLGCGLRMPFVFGINLKLLTYS